MSTTVRHALGDMSSAGTGKFAAALFTSTPGKPERRFRLVERRGDLIGVADVTRDDGDRRADRFDRLLARVEVLGLAARDHQRRAEARELGGDRLPEPGARAGDEHADAVVGARLERGLPHFRRVRQTNELGHLIQLPV